MGLTKPGEPFQGPGPFLTEEIRGPRASPVGFEEATCGQAAEGAMGKRTVAFQEVRVALAKSQEENGDLGHTVTRK